MTSSSSSAFVLALLANLALAGTACSGFDAEPDATPGPTQLPPRSDDEASEAPKAPPVGGPASTSELTDAFGIFVSMDGKADAAGTTASPIASVQAAIDLAKRAGKRVYVCTGTYREALVIADSISVIGGLACERGEWRTSDGRTRIESPTSPAVRATDIASPTRIEGLDIIAPKATTPSASSIGLIADKASALVIARSKIVAGDGGNGDHGTEGTQLTTPASARGGAGYHAAQCALGGTCYTGFTLVRPGAAAGGTNPCDGAPGHAAEGGGSGGRGGLWEVFQDVNFYFRVYGGAINNADNGVKTLTSAAGASSPDGANGALVGTLSPDGYVPATGIAGTDGAPGKGGNGGSGRSPYPTIDPQTSSANGVWRGYGGAGGGAGGCPGLAGTPGKGGGASIAALLINSAMTFETSELVAARGGDAGLGTFGSTPTAGGAAGFVVGFGGSAFIDGQPGGQGGSAGISGNGSSGPSLGIAHVGLAPKLGADSKITAGAGGAAIAARSRTLGITKTIPETKAGTTKDVLAF